MRWLAGHDPLDDTCLETFVSLDLEAGGQDLIERAAQQVLPLQP